MHQLSQLLGPSVDINQSATPIQRLQDCLQEEFLAPHFSGERAGQCGGVPALLQHMQFEAALFSNDPAQTRTGCQGSTQHIQAL